MTKLFFAARLSNYPYPREKCTLVRNPSLDSSQRIEKSFEFRDESTTLASDLFRLFDYDQVARLFFRQRIAGESRPRPNDARSRVVTPLLAL